MTNGGDKSERETGGAGHGRKHRDKINDDQGIFFGPERKWKGKTSIV